MTYSNSETSTETLADDSQWYEFKQEVQSFAKMLHQANYPGDLFERLAACYQQNYNTTMEKYLSGYAEYLGLLREFYELDHSVTAPWLAVTDS